MRLLFSAVLRNAGYDVIACEDGIRALKAAQSQIEVIDGIITDARMPGLSGVELVRRIRSMRPSLPAIVVSGTVTEGVEPQPSTVYLYKPIAPSALLEELRGLLCGSM